MTRSREPAVHPPGDPKTGWRKFLQAGSDVLQSKAPLRGFDIYVAGFHCARDDAGMQMEAHHYCKQVNSEFLQCILFDGNTEEANLIGIEYIVSERLFHALPDAEQALWHPHNYEVLSGQLTAPGLPAAAEHALMKLLINSYGKTWHTWHTGRHDHAGTPPDALPLGAPRLMWSFNRDGEVDERLRAEVTQALAIDELEQRKRRRDLATLAHPQRGVNLMSTQFPHASGRPEGVRDVEDGSDSGR
jgi:hypothetical protein